MTSSSSVLQIEHFLSSIRSLMRITHFEHTSLWLQEPIAKCCTALKHKTHASWLLLAETSDIIRWRFSYCSGWGLSPRPLPPLSPLSPRPRPLSPRPRSPLPRYCCLGGLTSSMIIIKLKLIKIEIMTEVSPKSPNLACSNPTLTKKPLKKVIKLFCLLSHSRPTSSLSLIPDPSVFSQLLRSQCFCSKLSCWPWTTWQILCVSLLATPICSSKQ